MLKNDTIKRYETGCAVFKPGRDLLRRKYLRPLAVAGGRLFMNWAAPSFGGAAFFGAKARLLCREQRNELEAARS